VNIFPRGLWIRDNSESRFIIVCSGIVPWPSHLRFPSSNDHGIHDSQVLTRFLQGAVGLIVLGNFSSLLLLLFPNLREDVGRL